MPVAAHPVRDHCLAPERSIDAPIAPIGGRYGRAFGDLPALTGDQAALLALGTAGERLGEVGGRLVAEVLLGLLDADPESYRALGPGWQPTLPAAAERFTVLDLLVGAS